MALVEVLFVICWVFSLALFFLMGFAVSGIVTARAKTQMITSGKEAVLTIIEKVKENGHTERIYNGATDSKQEDEPEHLGDWGDYDRNVTGSDPEAWDAKNEQG